MTTRLLLVLMIGLFGCKPRSTASLVRTAAAGDTANAGVNHLEPGQQAAEMMRACEGKPGFHGVTSAMEISYSVKRRPDDVVQDIWVDGRARYIGGKDGGWYMDNKDFSKDLPICLRHNTGAPATAVMWALGCYDGDPCPLDEDKVCIDPAECPERNVIYVGDVDERRLEEVQGFALAGGVECKALDGRRGTIHVPHVNGRAIGSTTVGFTRAGECQELVAGMKNDLICSWTGKVFAVYNSQTLKVSGSTTAGYKEAEDCISNLVQKSKDKVVCSWTGRAFAPYYSPTGRIIGSTSQSREIATCLAQVETYKPSLDIMCSWNGNAFQLYKAETGRPHTSETYRNITMCSIDAHLASIDANLASIQAMLGNENDNEANDDADDEPVVEIPAEEAQPDPRPDNSDSPLASIELNNRTSFGDLLQLWYPNEENGDVGYTLEKCHDPNLWYHIVKHQGEGANRTLVEECRLDTFYSWGPEVKLNYHKRLIGEGANEWPDLFTRVIDGREQNSMLFMTQSPAATFGYGEYPLRIKLKRNVKYRLLIQRSPRDREEFSFSQYCEDVVTRDNWDDTVLIRQWVKSHGSGLDFILCGPGPIASWSYGTKRHYDEIVKDVKWIEANDHKEEELYYKKDGVDQWMGYTLDSKRFDEKTLRTGMVAHLKLARQNNDEAKVFFNPDGGESSIEEHFSTRFPIYYNQE